MGVKTRHYLIVASARTHTIGNEKSGLPDSECPWASELILKEAPRGVHPRSNASLGGANGTRFAQYRSRAEVTHAALLAGSERPALEDR